MASADILFGEWLPSSPDFKNPGVTEADNVIPTTNAYKPLLGVVGSSETVGASVLGARQFFDNAGTPVTVGGTDTSLFVRRSAITSTAGLVSLGSSEAWDFARYNDFVFATGANNPVQYLDDVDTDDSWSALTGSPPSAKRCARVGEFLMLGNLSGNSAGIAWSSFNSPAGSWTPDRLTQAGNATPYPEFGAVQKIIGGRYALLFQERGISRISYVGPPTVWRIDVIAEDKGAIAPHSVVNIGYQTYFLDKDGFHKTNGSSFEPLGSRRVNKWFFENVDQTAIADTHASIDWQNECVIWAFKSRAGMGYDRQIIYSWAQGRWSTGSVKVGWLVESNVDGVTLEDLDGLYADLDAMPISLDNSQLEAGDRRLGLFTSSGEFASFSGAPLEATFVTGEAQVSSRQWGTVTGIAPLVDAESWDMSGSLLLRLNKARTRETASRRVGNHGFIPVRGEGNKIAVKLVIDAGTVWDDAQGVQIIYTGRGKR